MTAYHRQKGSSFERLVADYLKANGFPFADRRVKSGAKDKGDIGGVGTDAGRLVLECKNTSKISLGTWAAEAETERVNDEALAGVVIHKRHGKGKAGEQWATMPLADLVAILTGKRPMKIGNTKRSDLTSKSDIEIGSSCAESVMTPCANEDDIEAAIADLVKEARTGP